MRFIDENCTAEWKALKKAREQENMIVQPLRMPGAFHGAQGNQ
jgi:hypothetical protein